MKTRSLPVRPNPVAVVMSASEPLPSGIQEVKPSPLPPVLPRRQAKVSSGALVGRLAAGIAAALLVVAPVQASGIDLSRFSEDATTISTPIRDGARSVHLSEDQATVFLDKDENSGFGTGARVELSIPWNYADAAYVSITGGWSVDRHVEDGVLSLSFDSSGGTALRDLLTGGLTVDIRPDSGPSQQLRLLADNPRVVCSESACANKAAYLVGPRPEAKAGAEAQVISLDVDAAHHRVIFPGRMTQLITTAANLEVDMPWPADAPDIVSARVVQDPSFPSSSIASISTTGGALKLEVDSSVGGLRGLLNGYSPIEVTDTEGKTHWLKLNAPTISYDVSGYAAELADYVQRSVGQQEETAKLIGQIPTQVVDQARDRAAEFNTFLDNFYNDRLLVTGLR